MPKDGSASLSSTNVAIQKTVVDSGLGRQAHDAAIVGGVANGDRVKGTDPFHVRRLYEKLWGLESQEGLHADGKIGGHPDAAGAMTASLMKRLHHAGVESGPHVGEEGTFSRHTEIGCNRSSRQKASRGSQGTPARDLQFARDHVRASEGNDPHGDVLMILETDDDFSKGSISPDRENGVAVFSFGRRDFACVAWSRREPNLDFMAVPAESVAEKCRRRFSLESAGFGIGDDEQPAH